MAATLGAGALAVVATVGTAGVAGVAVLGGLVSSVISGGLLSDASKTLNVVEDRLSEKRRALAEINIQLAEHKGKLNLQEHSQQRLASLI
jgi:hypothetical protein